MGAKAAPACDRSPAKSPEDIRRELFETPHGRRYCTLRPNGVGLTHYAQHYLRLATPECHERWYAAFATSSRLLFKAPRSHGKSISAGRVLVGHAIITNRNVRILLISKTKDAASKTARLVRRDLEKNERIRADWLTEKDVPKGTPAKAAEDVGARDFREEGLPWTDSMFYVRRSLDARDPTVEAVGVCGSITGGRFDLIIVDDPVDDENTHTRARRKKTHNWFYGTVLPLLDNEGRIVVIGTKKHADDLYTSLENDPTFDEITDGAFVDGLSSVDMERVRWVEKINERTGRKQLVDAIYEPAANDDGTPGAMPRVLWREKWGVSSLLLKLRSMGSVLFLRELQNEITDDGSSPFKIAWLNKAKQLGAERGFLRWGVVPEGEPGAGEEHPRCAGLIVYQCWDLTLVHDEESAEEADSDYTVGQTWGLDWESGRRYLLRAVRRRGLTPTELIALIKAEAALFPQRIAVVVENNSFGKLYELGLRRVAGLPVYGHTTTGRVKNSPFEGVPSMGALYENGHIVLPYSAHPAANEEDPRPYVDEHIREHHGLGRENHDDCTMSAHVGDVWIRRWIRVQEKRRAAQSGAGSGRARVQRVA